MQKITDIYLTDIFLLDGSSHNTSDPLPFPYLSAPPPHSDLGSESAFYCWTLCSVG